MCWVEREREKEKVRTRSYPFKCALFSEEASYPLFKSVQALSTCEFLFLFAGTIHWHNDSGLQQQVTELDGLLCVSHSSNKLHHPVHKVHSREAPCNQNNNNSQKFEQICTMNNTFLMKSLPMKQRRRRRREMGRLLVEHLAFFDYASDHTWTFALHCNLYHFYGAAVTLAQYERFRWRNLEWLRCVKQMWWRELVILQCTCTRPHMFLSLFC